MKRIFSFFLAALMALVLTGCQDAPKPLETQAAPIETTAPTAPAPDADAFRFTRENFPRIDGSTSMVPLGQGISSVLLGESREDAADLINFNRTTQSFRNLCNGLCDLVIAAEPKASVFTEMREATFPYLMETIAREALVFVVNADNPVNSLTAQQVRDIYAGNITNWKEVGGEDMPIVAFQRNATAGSQVMMEKLVMEDTAMMKAPATQVPAEMAGLIDAVRSYDNSANAIGYTVFFYAADMQMAQGLKLLKIDGITPCAQTIRSGEYPYLNGYYCCISATAAADSPERRLFNWLVSDAGQTLLNLEGYVAVTEPGQAESSGSNVFTDFTQYAPIGRSAAKFQRIEGSLDHLRASDDYGLIFPYDGAQLYGSWDNENSDFWAGTQRGFYNHRGQLITDPVYSMISYSALGPDDYYWVFSTSDQMFGFAAKDGSFVSDCIYFDVYSMGSHILAVKDFDVGAFDLYSSDFRLEKTQEDFLVHGFPLLPDTYVDGRYSGLVRDNSDEPRTYALMDEEGRLLMESTSYFSLEQDGTISCYDDDWNVTILDRDFTPVKFGDLENITYITHLNENFISLSDTENKHWIVDQSGNLFEWDFDYCYMLPEGRFSVVRGDQQTVYDARGRVLAVNLSNDWTYLGNGIFLENFEDSLTLHRPSDGKELHFPDGSYAYQNADVICVSCLRDDGWYCRMVDRDMNILPESYAEMTAWTDLLTGKVYILAYGGSGFYSDQRLLSADGRTEYMHANGSITVQNDFITVTSDWSFTCYDPEGNVVFCYPYYGLSTGD